MATAKVIIKNRKMEGHNGVYFQDMQDNYIRINGWDVRIENDKIIAVCERVYSDGIHRKEKTFKLQDGLLGLAGGNVDERYAYFRTADFQNLLDKYGITAVKKQDPNQEYILRVAHYGGGKSDAEIITDGEKILVDVNTGRTDQWRTDHRGTCAFEENQTYVVRDATYVIIKQSTHERDSHCYSKILYTDKNVFEIIFNKEPYIAQKKTDRYGNIKW